MNAESLEAVNVVKAPVLAVVAPTVPLMLIEAVPVRLVTTPDEGVPNAGVTRVGLLAKTKAPVPVSSDTAAARLADDGVAKKVATPEPKPLTPVLMGKPVALVKVPEEGVPSTPPSTTNAPAEPTLTAKAVATPVPKPLMPEEAGKPVALVRLMDEGVPRAGVTSVGLLAKTNEPEPVSSVTAAARLADEGVPKNVAIPAPKLAIPVPPFATGKMPVTPVVSGSPVAFVSVSTDGVPRAGVTSVGELEKTKAPEPVSSDTAAARLNDEGVARNVATPEPSPEMPEATGSPVAFVSVTDDGVPNAGVTSVGLLAKTLLPVPVLVTLTTSLLALSAKAVDAVRPDRVVVPLTVKSVKKLPPPTLPIFMKSVPLNAMMADSPLTIVMPVCPTALNTMDCVPPEALITV